MCYVQGYRFNLPAKRGANTKFDTLDALVKWHMRHSASAGNSLGVKLQSVGDGKDTEPKKQQARASSSKKPKSQTGRKTGSSKNKRGSQKTKETAISEYVFGDSPIPANKPRRTTPSYVHAFATLYIMPFGTVFSV